MKKTDNTPAKCRSNKILRGGLIMNFIWAIMLTACLASCKDEFIIAGFGDEPPVDADEVNMPLYLSIAPMEGEDPQTRAWTYIEASDEEKTIADLWVIEYNEDGLRVGLPRFYEIRNTITDGRVDPIVMEDFMILRPREEDHEYTVVVIANTHNNNLFNANNRSKFSSLDSLRAYDLDIHNQEDLFDPHPDDQHELKYLLMSGWTKINKDTEEFKVNLIRNTCKVNVKLTKFCDDKLIIKYIQWVNMPQGKLFPHGTVEHYVESVSRDWRMHNEASYFEALLDEDEGLTFWVPCNVWLPEEDIADASKPSQATVSATNDSDIKEDPTHFDIVCRSNEDEDDLNLYEFRIYPSRDGNTQCRFEPNHYYHIEVAIDAIPAEENDFFKKTVFNDLDISNSYILQQDTKGIYTIGFTRPNLFWEHFGSDKMIEDGTEWVAEVIWQDTDQRVVDFAIFSIGEVTADRSRFFGEGNTCIPFRTTGTGLGNVIIGVRARCGGEEDMTKEELDEIYPIEEREYLWSWHLWITDYQPDMVGNYGASAVNNAFYQVPGGQVIQMGINQMMDRNLGAWAPEVKDSSNPEDIINTFGFYYQYGRKDPFPYFNPKRRAVYDINGNKIPAFNEQQVTFPVTTRVPIVDENGKDVKDKDGNSTYNYEEEIRTETITMMAADGGSFTYGVLRPYMFWADAYNTHHWASDVGEVELFGGWYFTTWYKNLMLKLSEENGSYWDMKDIFDPCPVGWVMDSSTGDFYEGSTNYVGAATELFYGQTEYLLWKGTINDDGNQSVKFEDTEENRAKIKEYLKLEKEFWEDLNDKSVSTSGAPSPFMGSYLYYASKPGTSYFPAAGSRNRYGAGDRFHNYMCLPWSDVMMRLTSFGWKLINEPDEKKKFDEEFSTAVAMQVRCVRL